MVVGVAESGSARLSERANVSGRDARPDPWIEPAAFHDDAAADGHAADSFLNASNACVCVFSDGAGSRHLCDESVRRDCDI